MPVIFGKRGMVLAAALFLCASGLASAQELAYAIFVRVNGKPITRDNVVQAVEYLIKREYNKTPPEDEEEQERLQDAALRDLVRTLLIQSEASQRGIKLDRQVSKRALAMSGMKQEDISPTIRRMIEADDLFEELMISEGTPIKNPTPREIKDFYSRNKEQFRTNAFVIVRTIFIPGDTSQPQSYFKSRAEDLQREIEATPLDARTAFFAKKAAEVSQDVFAKFGGRLTMDSPEPWIPQEFANAGPDGKEMLPGPMAEAIHRLNRKGEVRLAVSKEGMHLMYLEDIKGGETIGWEEASKMIEYLLRQQNKDARMRQWIDRIFSRSDVRWNDGTVYEKAKLKEALLPSERNMIRRRD